MACLVLSIALASGLTAVPTRTPAADLPHEYGEAFDNASARDTDVQALGDLKRRLKDLEDTPLRGVVPGVHRAGREAGRDPPHTRVEPAELE